MGFGQDELIQSTALYIGLTKMYYSLLNAGIIIRRIL
jgi:hypothetical protein